MRLNAAAAGSLVCCRAVPLYEGVVPTRLGSPNRGRPLWAKNARGGLVWLAQHPPMRLAVALAPAVPCGRWLIVHPDSASKGIIIIVENRCDPDLLVTSPAGSDVRMSCI